MTQPTLNFVLCRHASETYRMAYWHWGNPAAEHLIVCVHGLTLEGRTFSQLATELVRRSGGKVRIICPDLVGRGRSNWLADYRGYQIPQYCQDILTLLAQEKFTQLDWVGTSMGGLAGIELLGRETAQLPWRHLVLNDIGPTIDLTGHERIRGYVGVDKTFDNFQAGLDGIYPVWKGFGIPDEQDLKCYASPLFRSLRSTELLDDGEPVRFRYDTNIARLFNSASHEALQQAEQVMWQRYDHIHVPTLLLRGKDSDILSHETALNMTQRGPKARLIEFEGVAHSPSLVSSDQVDPVCQFLLE